MGDVKEIIKLFFTDKEFRKDVFTLHFNPEKFSKDVHNELKKVFDDDVKNIFKQFEDKQEDE